MKVQDPRGSLFVNKQHLKGRTAQQTHQGESCEDV